MKFPAPRLVSTLLVILGALASGYLLWRRIQLAGGAAEVGGDVCKAVFGRGCDALLTSPESFRLGLPLAGWGLIFYLILGVLLLLGAYLRSAFAFEAHCSGFLMALLSLPAGVYLASGMLTGRTPFCPLCVLTHLINLALFFSFWRLTGESFIGIIRAIASGGGYLLTGRTTDPVQARWKLVTFFGVLVVAMAAYQRLVILTATPAKPLSGPSLTPEQLVAGFETIPEQDIPVGPEDAVLGSAEAPVQIVVFGEFECPACRRYAGELHSLAGAFPGRLQVVFKHFPLARACNRSVPVDLHPQACEAAYAAEAARMLGGFWPFHDRLFAQGNPASGDFAALAEELGLDVRSFEAARHGEAARAKVREDVELGIRLGVEGTPSLFLNRRRISNIEPRMLRSLVEQILAKQDRAR